jgi:TRAP-type uncharacterized transport system substrate-binding protein
MFALWAAPARAEPIAVLTGGSSGVYYPLGVSIAMVYADIPGAKVLVETTDGSVENLMRLQQGTGQVAFALGDALSWIACASSARSIRTTSRSSRPRRAAFGRSRT